MKECEIMKQELTGDDRVWLVHPEVISVDIPHLLSYQLKWALSSVDSNITDKELLILAYIHLYGKDALDKCVEAGLYKSRKSLENIISKYRKLDVITGKGDDIKLNEGIVLVEGNISITIKYKVDV